MSLLLKQINLKTIRLIVINSRMLFNYQLYNCQKIDPFSNENKNVFKGSIMIYRNKYDKVKTGKSKQIVEDSDDENEFATLETELDKDTKIVKTHVNSLRADLLIKAGLGLARNKVENIFYESKIRINGKKLMKKSAPLQVGDEIDVIKGFSTINPNHLIVARIEILDVTPKEESILVSLRRNKTLTIENYEDNNQWKNTTSIV